MPDRVLLSLSGDPATTRSVTWRTDLSVANPLAQLAIAEDGPDFPKKSKTVKPVSQTLDADLGPAAYHTVKFTGLAPGLQYVYRVGDGANWSEWNQFRTATSGPDRLKFIYVGDAQNDIYEMWSRLIRQGFTSAPDADFLLHAGDLVNEGNRDADWGEWFAAAGWINRTIPALATPGNHEYPRRALIGPPTLSDHWIPQFGLPENGLPGLEETSYYVDIQGVRMVSLNSNVMRREQAEWLDTTLSNNPNRWTILAFHHPIYSSAKARDNKGLREAWQPAIDKHKVDLVLQGHDHSYARSNLVTGANAREGAHGTVYVVSVSGPKMYEVDQQEWMERMAERTQLFQVIEIDGNVLKYEARTARGLLYDAFELRKRGDKPNELINRAGKIPLRMDDAPSSD
jgi:3',5'-cyclic AMP phosphodiesterase CpdA